MSLFLHIRRLDTREPEAFVTAWAAGAGSGIRCLKHWVSGNLIALLVEAPSEASLRAYDPDAAGVTQLFSPAQRWLAHETLDLGP